MTPRFYSILAAGLVTLAAGNVSAEGAGRTIIVMDGSGSMWGQIDGRPKLEIARETVAEVLSRLPADRELGLIAYGHRERGNCSDIELVVPAGKGTADAVLKAVNTMRFLGKTPLSEAVRRAAEALRYGEEKATVVLVTDGLETCGADPCALGRALEESGLDFTAHVIGFGLTRDQGRQVACLAENTGGRYIEAGNAGQLVEAMTETVLAEPPAAVATPTPPPETTPPAPEPPPPPPAALTAPASAPLGSTIEVGWTGPGGKDDYIDVVLPGQTTERAIYWAAVADGNPAKLKLPVKAGAYTIRYMMQRDSKTTVLAEVPIKVTELEFFVDAPTAATTGQVLSLPWIGRTTGGEYSDYIDIVPQGSEATEGELSYAYVSGGNPASLQAPVDAGEYDIRYVLDGTGGRVVRYRAPLSVALAPTKLAVPAAVRPGASFPVEWFGPNVPSDYVDLVPEGYAETSGELSYFYTADVSGPGQLTAPDAPGTYRVRYVLQGPNSRRAVLDAVTLTVSPDAPATPLVGDDGVGAVLAAREAAAAASAPVAPPPPPAATPAAPSPAAAPDDEAALREDVGYRCAGPGACAITDEQTGLAFSLPAGWYTDYPANGPDGVTLRFHGPGEVPATVVLNPPDGALTAPVCKATAAGNLCRDGAATGLAAGAQALIAASLKRPGLAAGTPLTPADIGALLGAATAKGEN